MTLELFHLLTYDRSSFTWIWEAFDPLEIDVWDVKVLAISSNDHTWEEMGTRNANTINARYFFMILFWWFVLNIYYIILYQGIKYRKL